MPTGGAAHAGGMPVGNAGHGGSTPSPSGGFAGGATAGSTANSGGGVGAGGHGGTDVSAGGDGGDSGDSACTSDDVCPSGYPRQELGSGVTCRGQFADWKPSDSPTTFVDNLDGTVADTRSGLLWQQTVEAGSYTWAEANEYCAELPLAGTSWRVPTEAELQSIVDFGRHSPAIDPVAFPGTPDGTAPEGTSQSWFWSSSRGSNSGSLWIVTFDRGLSFEDTATSHRHVRCVHSSAPVTVEHGCGGAPLGRYTIDENAGTVYDTRTQLTWQRAVTDNEYDLADAASYCSELALAGGGWRLPQVSELLTIVDPTQHDPAIDPLAFPSTPLANFWSSSAFGSPPGYGFILYSGPGYFTSAVEVKGSVVYHVHARCVR